MLYEETHRKNIRTQLPSRSVLIASQLRTKCSKTSYTVCVYTRGAKEKFHETTFVRRRVTREFVYYDEFINPVLKIYYLYVYIYRERKFESIFISIRLNYISSRNIFVVGKRLNDGCKINSEVVLVRKPSKLSL